MHMGNGQAWLEAADTACYIAKRTGRGQLRSAARAQDDVIAIKQRPSDPAENH
jgi:hypothetical protein